MDVQHQQQPHPDVLSNVTYVDLAHRVQPEGIESDQLYDENESYRRKADTINEISSKEKVVYATIKTDMPILPAKEMLYEKENILDEDTDTDDIVNDKIQQDVIDRGYISPQKILDPTCARLHNDDKKAIDDYNDDKDIEDLFNKKLPPIPVCGSETETEEEEMPPASKKVPPPIPELNSPLDLQDVEYADASDTEEDKNVNNKIKNNDSNANEENVIDAMTQDEAERLLSSRFVY